jgi:adenylate cyclase
VTVVAVVAVSAGVLALRMGGALESAELAGWDWFIRLRPDPSVADPRIALVAISDADITAHGPWPLSDDTLARALEALVRHRPRAVGIDLYRDAAVPPGAERLDAVLRAHPAIVGVMKFGAGGAEVRPHPALAGTEQVGFSDFVVDRGGTVRRGLLFLDDGAVTAQSLALRLALLYLAADGIGPRPDPRDETVIRLGPTSIPPFEADDGPYVRADARGYQMLLDFKGAGRPFATIGLAALLSGAFDPATVRDRVVILGVTADSVKDFFVIPHSHGRATAQQVAGIAVHAHVVSQFLRMALDGDPAPAIARGWQETLWIVLWGALGGAVGMAVRRPGILALALGGGVALVGAVDFLAFARGFWLPLVPPAMAWIGSSVIVTAYVSYREKRERAAVMRLFSRAVSKEVAEELWRQRDDLLEGGRARPQRMTATVMFTDLAGFTTLTEKLPPAVLVPWLEELMDAMTRVVIAHGGVINKYIGDAIMALFGVPLARTTDAEVAADARAAVRCALALGETLAGLNRRWRAEGRPTTAMRIGIATGAVVAGSIGSAERAEYTVIGDIVNVAARLESVDKETFVADLALAPCRILIAETTLYHLGDLFSVERIGDVVLKGKAETLTVYSVVSGQARVPSAVPGKEELA